MLEFIGDVIGHTTARLLMPLLSLGRVRVQPLTDTRQRFGWWGIRRQTDGTYLVDWMTAECIGIFFWIGVLVVFVALVR